MPMTSPPNNATAESWLESLQESGYRLTAPRRAIVSIIANAPRALDAIEIYDQGRVEHPRLGLVTVYRTLEKLEQLDLIQRVHQPEGCNMYMRAPQGHEHLLLCKSCGQMEYFSGDDLSKLIEETSRSSGFQIQEHWLQLGGLCANCQPPTSPEEGV
jgi:Fur family ferric uptake transcriptional regulator